MQPSFEEVKALADSGTTIPVYLELLADQDTPVSAYWKLGGGPGSFLLESVEGGEHLGRYSFIGLEPVSTLVFGEGIAELRGELGNEDLPFSDPLVLLDSLIAQEREVPVSGLPRFHGGVVGYFSYDVVRYFERVPEPASPGPCVPLASLGWYKTILAFDHLRRTIKLITHLDTRGDLSAEYEGASRRLQDLADRLAGHNGIATERLESVAPGQGVSASRLHSNVSRQQFEDSVRRAKEYIAAGDIIQVVLSQRFSAPTDTTPLTLYRALRAVNPSPYMYFLDYGSFQIVGASPEMLVRVDEGEVSIHPIAGTRRRGQTASEDDRLATELASDEKERAEHFMLLDLGRNDVGRVSEPGSVRVARMLEVERYSHVMHLVSEIKGRLSSSLRPVDALRAGFPAGTVTGAPKVRATEIISELEPEGRGPYAGAVGYIGFDGNLDTAITIRTVLLNEGTAYVQVGAGVVADSVPELEYEETVNKAAAMVRALELAEGMERAGARVGSRERMATTRKGGIRK